MDTVAIAPGANVSRARSSLRLEDRGGRDTGQPVVADEGRRPLPAGTRLVGHPGATRRRRQCVSRNPFPLTCAFSYVPTTFRGFGAFEEITAPRNNEKLCLQQL